MSLTAFAAVSQVNLSRQELQKSVFSEFNKGSNFLWVDFLA